VSDLHTAFWLWSLIPVSAAGFLAWGSVSIGQPWPITGAIGVVVFAAASLTVLGFLGNRAESATASVTKKKARSSQPRVIVDVTPEYLMRLYENKMSAQAQTLAAPYIGKWLRIQGKLEDIRRSYGGAVSVSLQREGAVSGLNLHAFFDGDWYDRLIVMPSGTKVSLIGQIFEVEKFNVMLHNCELVQEIEPPAKAFQ
jgi:hypothetical protein